jgi:signal transduction histidine kinase
LFAIRQLARDLFETRGDVSLTFQTLAACLSTSFCDGCSIVISPRGVTMPPVTCHSGDASDELLPVSAAVAERTVFAFETADEARTALPSYTAYIRRFGLRGAAVLPISAGTLLRGTVIATRNGSSIAFTDEDLLAIAICIDYTSLSAESAMQLEVERSAVRAEREQKAQFHQELLRIVSHDLRAPLGGILLGTEILVQSQNDAPAAQRIASFAKRMSRMVDQIVDLTRVRLGGGIPIARCRTTLLPLIRSTIKDLASAHPAARFELVSSPDAKGLWDMDRLGQVFANVLGNAAQYGQPGALITIDVTHSDGATRISVHNELREHAVAPERLAKMFEPFQRNTDHEHAGTGLGLGLYISDEIVRAHGGHMTMQSSSAGTVVGVVLPDAAPRLLVAPADV